MFKPSSLISHPPLLITLISLFSVFVTSSQPLDSIARSYVHLVLSLGKHDPDLVDAYYGPSEWMADAERQALSAPEIGRQARELLNAVTSMQPPKDTIGRLRHEYLRKQLIALHARADFVQGTKLKFDDESRVMFDAVAPTYSEAHFAALLKELEAALPGKEPLLDRLEGFRTRFLIPRDKLDTVFAAAIAECRRRTREHIAIPSEESFAVEFVTGKPWSGYNWYQGNSRSIIQGNVDLPITIDRAVDLAAHEGYPGHHVYNALLEQHLVREKRWMEFSVYMLFSPQSLIAEGSANYGIDVVLPGKERIAFEQRVLFPLAGLDPNTAEQYYKIQSITAKLAFAHNEAARGFLNGTIDRAQAIRLLTTYALMSLPRAEQRTRFIERYRSYVINYNYGQELVKTYVESNGGTSDNPDRRWEVFKDLLSSPRLPSGLMKN